MYHVSFKESIIPLGLLYVLTNVILQLNNKKKHSLPGVSSHVRDSTHIPLNTRINWLFEQYLGLNCRWCSTRKSSGYPGIVWKNL